MKKLLTLLCLFLMTVSVKTNAEEISYNPSVDIKTYGTAANYAYQGISRKTLNVIICISNAEIAEISLAEMHKEMEKAKKYFREVSYKKIDLKIQYLGEINRLKKTTAKRLQEPVTKTHELPENTDIPFQEKAALRICDPAVDFKTADMFIIYPMQGMVGNGIYKTLDTEEGKVELAVVYIGTSYFFSGILEHEMGHALFGFGHAGNLQCQHTAFQSTGCEINGYGNTFDTMGTAYPYPKHFSGWLKYAAGLAKALTVKQNGTYSLAALERRSSNPHVLRIPLKENPICIEYRKPRGFDGKKNELSVIPQKGCLLINTCDISPRYPREPRPPFLLLSGTSETFEPCIKERQVFQNNDLGVTVSFTQKNNNTAAVNLNLNKNLLQPLPDLNLQYGLSIAKPCNLTGEISIMVTPGNERDLELGSFYTVKLIGIDEQENEHILLQEKIQHRKPGQTAKVIYNNMKPYIKIRAVADVFNEIQESDETNNEAERGIKCE